MTATEIGREYYHLIDVLEYFVMTIWPIILLTSIRAFNSIYIENKPPV